MAYEDKVHLFIKKYSVKKLVKTYGDSFLKWKILALRKVKNFENNID
jgi:hypothetical protein